MGIALDTETGVKITVIAIREVLMDYFKDGCSQKMVEYSQVSVQPEPANVRYHFERDTENIRKRRKVLIGNAPIMRLERDPERVTLFTGILQRSPEFREIQGHIEKFMEKYLPGIELEVHNGKII